MSGLLAVSFVLLVAQGPAGGGAHPFDYPQPDDLSGGVYAVIEIPAGSFVKYELDPVTGVPVVDRFVSVSAAYPANYGCFSQTLSGDGDPLDVLVYTRSPLVPGCLIRVRPIGVLRSTDGGEEDDKVIAVPVSKIDPTYDEVVEVDQLPAIERERLVEFFLSYKKLPAGRKKVEVKGFEGKASAVQVIESARKRYNESARGRATRSVPAAAGTGG